MNKFAINKLSEMASKQVLLKDLKVADLKRELEEQEWETTGKKADLQSRLREALENEGEENPNTYLFEIAGDINLALQSLVENSNKMQHKLDETSGNLRGMEQNLREMEQKLIDNLDQKLQENSSCLQKQMGEYVDEKFEEIESKLVTVEEFQNNFLEAERRIATLSLESGEQQRMVNTALKPPGSDRLSKPELSNYMEISKIRMKPHPAAAKANGWSLAEKATALTLALRGDATDILQTLSLEEQEDYHQLVRHLEMRYGQSHLEHVYHSQLKNRYQKSNESLQEFEADIARLVRLAYSSTPENVMERLAVQAFLDGLRDTETRQALTLARPSKLVDALARALEFEAAKQTCRGQAKIRKMEEDVEKGICNEAEIRRVVKEILDKRPIRRWNGAKVRHIRGRRMEKKKAPPSSEKDVIIRRLTVVNDGWQRDELLKDQESDPNLKPIVNWKKEDRKPTWEEFLHLFLLAYRSSIHETTGQTLSSIVMGRELRLPCDLKFGCTPGDDVAGEDYVSTLRQRIDDIHERVRSNIQGTSDRMKETYDINANDGRYQPGNQVWLYNPQRRHGLSPELQSSWEGPYEVVTRINDVVYRIQKLPRGKPRVVHFNRLPPFAGNNDEQAEARVRHVSPPDSDLFFEEFMLFHSNGQKARYGVTREEPRDLFQAPALYVLGLCLISETLDITKTIVHEIVSESLGIRKVCAKLVPKVLTDDQKARRVETSQELLDTCEDNLAFLDDVITGDESWVFEYDPETKRQRKVLRRDISKSWKLHHDNAPSHTCFLVADYLVKAGITIVPQPPYSPDKACTDALKAIPENDYRAAFDAWKTRWNRCVDAGGMYFESF
ncbi:hypothetical protein NQ318_022756 [Aromia moschata]|uniref:SAP domain-containing protein n=1 Tax=Aromia moschata TaxID=1265417 RepID=A0AAV8YC84_9CUCU|nr:hypothetical protein NQ318_022756 [Aromia moschata]